MNPQHAKKEITGVEFGPSPMAKTVFDKNIIAVFSDGSIQSIGTYTRIAESMKAMDKQIAQLTVNKGPWESVKDLCDAMPDFITANAELAKNVAVPTSTPAVDATPTTIRIPAVAVTPTEAARTDLAA